MNTETRNFDKEAAAWDENPGKLRLASNIASAIIKQVVLTPEINAMDFGCGTGLLTMQLQPFVRSITGVDNSRGMLDQFNKKIAKMKVNNVNSELVDLERGDVLSGEYDLIVSSMALHHMKDLKLLFRQFNRIAVPEGYVCVADLDLENGQFHDDNTGVFHFGFDRSTLHKVFTEAGFENVRNTTAAEVMKPAINGEMKRFSIFLMSGQKKQRI